MKALNTEFSSLDYSILLIYALVIIGSGLFVSRNKNKKSKSTKDYFLAGKSLVWWAIGTSCIAANISAEQLIGMSGTGFVIGLAVASYELISAINILVIAKFVLPIYLKENIYTMPQLLMLRFDHRVKTGLAFFWILVYIFVNLTSILYMGALATHIILDIPFLYGVLILIGIAAIYSLYGGLMAVAWTDIIQVTLLIAGGLLTAYFSLQVVSEDHGVWKGLTLLYQKAPEKFNIILTSQQPHYNDIPGVVGILGGMFIVANTFYWGTNQYTIQRALGAKNIREAQNGLLLAAWLKLVTALLVVIPGIAAFVIMNDPGMMSNLAGVDPESTPSVEAADRAYPWLLSLLPAGLKGLAFAALVAAIVSSVASMINSISTIFTMDIYNSFRKDVTDEHLLKTGRAVAFIALVIASLTTPALASTGQVFQYIQEFTGMVSPGIVAIFGLGLFWKRTTSNAALLIAFITLPISLFFFFFLPAIPFLNRMALVFFIVLTSGIVWSILESKVDSEKAIQLDGTLFRTSCTFNWMASILIGILAVFYWVFW